MIVRLSRSNQNSYSLPHIRKPSCDERVDLSTIKKLIGHSDIETTMIYSHLADEHVDKAVEKLDF